MAVSKTGGAFGYLHNSLGGLVYSAPKLGIAQEKVQVVRTKADSVSNPNTVAQIMQRMKLGAATRFYAAYENFVNKGLMSHSWESVKYGNPSRLYFMQKALKEEAAVYVPNGIDYFVPGEYQVSEGTIQSLPWRKELAAAPASVLFSVGTPLTAENVAALAALNVIEGDQITIMGAVHRNGRYFPAAARVIVGVGKTWDYTAAEWTNVLNQIVVGLEGTFAGGTLGELTLAGMAVIISRGQKEDKDARSTEVFLLVNGYQSLKSPEALQKAIYSYEQNITFNSLNSDWYLNQGNGQAFDGRVQLSESLLADNGDGLNTFTGEVLIGVKQSEISSGTLAYVVFTSDGTAAGQAYFHTGGNALAPAVFTDDSPVTGADIAAVMQENGYGSSIAYAQASAEIAAQGGFTLGE